MILPCPRCPKTAKNHLVAKRHRDSQHSSQMTSKSVQFWSQNGSKIGPKMVSERVLNLLLFLGCFLGPNWTQKWSQKGSKIGPKMGSAAQMCSWSPKWAPKWTQNGSGVPKWTQNGSQMAPKCDIRIRLATDPWHVAGPGGMRVALTIKSAAEIEYETRKGAQLWIQTSTQQQPYVI